jgi:hypothetical protein
LSHGLEQISTLDIIACSRKYQLQLVWGRNDTKENCPEAPGFI